jgi:hypothetical protein
MVSKEGALEARAHGLIDMNRGTLRSHLPTFPCELAFYSRIVSSPLTHHDYCGSAFRCVF